MGHKIVESEVPVGTWGNKYDSTKNPIKNFLLKKFLERLIQNIKRVEKEIFTISEIGCGEGHLSSLISDNFSNKKIFASDYSKKIVDFARKNNNRENISYSVANIYKRSELTKGDMVVCCEVLEHLEDPKSGLSNLAELKPKYALLSVPLEPWWRVVQFLSGNHISSFGNTPGHINHWSKKSFTLLVGEYFDIIDIKISFPWIIILAKPLYRTKEK